MDGKIKIIGALVIALVLIFGAINVGVEKKSPFAENNLDFKNIYQKDESQNLIDFGFLTLFKKVWLNFLGEANLFAASDGKCLDYNAPLLDTTIRPDGWSDITGGPVYLTKCAHFGGDACNLDKWRSIISKSEAMGLNPILLFAFWEKESRYGQLNAWYPFGCMDENFKWFDANLDCTVNEIATCVLAGTCQSNVCTPLMAMLACYVSGNSCTFVDHETLPQKFVEIYKTFKSAGAGTIEGTGEVLGAPKTEQVPPFPPEYDLCTSYDPARPGEWEPLTPAEVQLSLGIGPMFETPTCDECEFACGKICNGGLTCDLCNVNTDCIHGHVCYKNPDTGIGTCIGYMWDPDTKLCGCSQPPQQPEPPGPPFYHTWCENMTCIVKLCPNPYDSQSCPPNECRSDNDCITSKCEDIVCKKTNCHPSVPNDCIKLCDNNDDCYYKKCKGNKCQPEACDPFACPPDECVNDADCAEPQPTCEDADEDGYLDTCAYNGETDMPCDDDTDCAGKQFECDNPC